MARSRKKIVQPALSAARIERTALDLIEREGLDAFSTRTLAADLGCEAMSIYHYFPSKAHLMDALVDRVIAEVVVADAKSPPIERFRSLGHAYRDVAHRHPQFFRYLALHRLNTRAGLRALETFLEVFRQAGFGVEDTARLFRVVGYYLVGAALDETSGYAKGPSAVNPVADAIVAREFPEVAAAGRFFKPREHDATFALGLEILVAEIERRRIVLSKRGGKAARG